MSSGRTLSYWQEQINLDKQRQVALFVRTTAHDLWMLQGIHSAQKAHEIYRRDYSNWPSDCVKLVAL